MERRVVRKAAQLVALAHGLGEEGLGEGGERPRPIFWPAIKADEAEQEWDRLRVWVNQLRVRYPNLFRLPECWWRHNDLVEILAALRDFEHGCFSDAAPATAPVEWQRALRDMELRLEIWSKRLACGVPGRGHELPLDPDDAAPAGWEEFVLHDVDLRRSAMSRRDPLTSHEAESPTVSPSE